MTIQPASKNLAVYQGYTFSVFWTWANFDKQPIDLTGYSASIEARYSISDSEPFLTLSTANGKMTLGGPAGTISATMAADDTSSLTPGTGVWNLQVTDPNGTVSALIQGNVTVYQMPNR